MHMLGQVALSYKHCQYLYLHVDGFTESFGVEVPGSRAQEVEGEVHSVAVYIGEELKHEIFFVLLLRI